MDVAKWAKPMDALNEERKFYSTFGLVRDKAVASLKQLIADIESGKLLVQASVLIEDVSSDDFPMKVFAVEFHERIEREQIS